MIATVYHCSKRGCRTAPVESETLPSGWVAIEVWWLLEEVPQVSEFCGVEHAREFLEEVATWPHYRKVVD